jgi:hypothetical protein
MEFGASIFFTDYSINPAELAVDEAVANAPACMQCRVNSLLYMR